jgi:nucleoside-diphosphate-sugar epimerase
MWDLTEHVVVTGSLGRVGRAVCAALEAHGIPWHGIDTRAVPIFTPTGAFAHLKYDLLDYGATVEALAGARAVVHAAAIAFPSFESDQKTFVDNITTAYNVFSAACLHKLPKVIWLSSEEVYGHPFGKVMPDYVPIDEKHAFKIGNTYSLAKRVTESAAEFFAHKGTTSFLGIRSTVVQGPDDYRGYPALREIPEARMWSLWSYIDARDLARACRLALDADYQGSHVVNIAAADTVIDVPSRELARRFLPGVPVHWDATAPTYVSFCDGCEAQRLFGFTPAISWRRELLEDEAPPAPPSAGLNATA